MKNNQNMPKIRQMVQCIQDNSPQKCKVIDADFLQMQGLCLLAWVIEKSLSETQGYQQASVALYQGDKFLDVKHLIPARYYKEDGKKIITSSSYGIFSNDPHPALLEKRSDNQACVTLVCGQKPISQLLIQGNRGQKTL